MWLHQYIGHLQTAELHAPPSAPAMRASAAVSPPLKGVVPAGGYPMSDRLGTLLLAASKLAACAAMQSGCVHTLEWGWSRAEARPARQQWRVCCFWRTTSVLAGGPLLHSLAGSCVYQTIARRR